MQGLVYPFETREALVIALQSSGDDQDLALPCREGVRDGEWLLVTFAIEDEATSVAGRVCDRGAEFRLAFERRDWDRLLGFARGDERPSLPPPALSSVPEAISAPPGATALLLDDDASVLSIVRAVLAACGVATQSAHRAEEALELLRQHRFDLMVVEPALDGMNGLELCRRLRADTRYNDVPVLILSSHTSERDVHEALGAGADDFVGKPFRAHELRARVLGLLHRSRGNPECTTEPRY